MTHAMKKNDADVRVIDGSLVLSFPNAAEPVVWRMNLAQAKEAGFEVRESKGLFRLVQKSGADTQDIAAFDTRETAVDALMQVSSALQGGRKPANDIGGALKGEGVQWIVAIAGVLIVAGLFFYLTQITPVESNLTAGSTGATQTSTATSADPQSSSGVPVSADDFLKGQ